MSSNADLELLKQLALAPGPPGAEGPVRAIVRENLTSVGEITHDRLGSLLCTREGTDPNGPRIALDAHMDEVGFCVQSISSEGRIHFVTLGGWWGHVLLAQRVNIITEAGTLVPGVISSKPPHFLSAAERKNVLTPSLMTIDIGASTREQVTELGIQVGDPIAPHSEWLELAAGVVSCKAFDDRVGVGVLVETMRALADGADLASTVIGVAAVQEEVGCRGAQTSSALSRPDVALVLEGTPADDAPGTPARQAVLGQGPQLRFSDPTALSNRKLVRLVEKVARESGIPVQIAVRESGGTDARTIHVSGAGVPTIVIGVPSRYIHTHVSLIQPTDYFQAITLTTAVVRSLDRETVDSLYAF